jgi:predicted transcriptional regulator
VDQNQNNQNNENNENNANQESGAESASGKQGGFIAVLHSLEEQFYGPGTLSLSGSAIKILLYIRHRALRDWTKLKKIGKAEIRDATGIKERMVDYALRELEKKGHILVIRATKTGPNGKPVFLDNTYELNPAKYGDDYIYRPEKPSFKVIHGSKGHKSNPMQEPASGSVQDPASGVVQEVTPGNVPKHTESLENSASKNPLKEPILKELFPKQGNLDRKREETFSLFGRSGTETMKPKVTNYEEEAKRQIREAREAGLL